MDRMTETGRLAQTRGDCQQRLIAFDPFGRRPALWDKYLLLLRALEASSQLREKFIQQTQSDVDLFRGDT
jgi:hypothetical protein